MRGELRTGSQPRRHKKGSSMSALASPTQDRWLDLNDILRELVAQGRVAQEQAE